MSTEKQIARAKKPKLVSAFAVFCRERYGRDVPRDGAAVVAAFNEWAETRRWSKATTGDLFAGRAAL